MKHLVLSLLTVLASSCAVAQNAGDITLSAPDKTRGASVMKALADRHSERECADKELSTADLSDLVWAANGINRSDGKRTAPSAMNRQDIDVYVVMAKGAYRYLPKEHKLQLITPGDHRSAVAKGQSFVEKFPVSLVLVSDLSRFGNTDDHTRMVAAMDAGYVSQNICLFCSATGLVTVPRATMDSNELKHVLKLTDSQIPLLNNPVGYKK